MKALANPSYKHALKVAEHGIFLSSSLIVCSILGDSRLEKLERPGANPRSGLKNDGQILWLLMLAFLTRFLFFSSNRNCAAF
jgi:hypothetical protein